MKSGRAKTSCFSIPDVYRIQRAQSEPVPYLSACIQHEISMISFHRAKDNNKKNYFKWASSHTKDEIVKQLKNQAWDGLLKDLVYKDKEIDRGYLFELYVLHIFRKGGYIFDIIDLTTG